MTGEFVLPQLIAAAESGPEGGFVECRFDDCAGIPEVGHARQFAGQVLRPDGSVVPVTFIVGSGFYPSSPTAMAVSFAAAISGCTGGGGQPAQLEDVRALAA